MTNTNAEQAKALADLMMDFFEVHAGDFTWDIRTDLEEVLGEQIQLIRDQTSPWIPVGEGTLKTFQEYLVWNSGSQYMAWRTAGDKWMMTGGDYYIDGITHYKELGPGPQEEQNGK